MVLVVINMHILANSIQINFLSSAVDGNGCRINYSAISARCPALKHVAICPIENILVRQNVQRCIVLCIGILAVKLRRDLGLLAIVISHRGNINSMGFTGGVVDTVDFLAVVVSLFMTQPVVEVPRTARNNTVCIGCIIDTQMPLVMEEVNVQLGPEADIGIHSLVELQRTTVGTMVNDLQHVALQIAAKGVYDLIVIELVVFRQI